MVGEPLYQNSGQKLPVNPYGTTPNPNTNYYSQNPTNNQYPRKQLPKLPDNYTNPYYQVPQSGQYFADWSHDYPNKKL